MNICQLISEAKPGKYKIVSCSSPHWKNVIVTVEEPVFFNMDSVRAVFVHSAPKGSPAEKFINKATPLVGAVVTAKFEEVN